MLVGDPNQLSPTVLSDVGKGNGLNLSLYSRLYSIFKQRKNGSVTMLKTQYRMHSAICQFPSAFFYENRLNTHYSVDEEMAHFPLQPIVYYDMTQSKHDVDRSGSSFNIAEVNFIERFCKLLATDITVWESLVAASSEHHEESSISNTTPILFNDNRSIAIQQHIAVITPYQAQSGYCRERLPQHIEVMTADSSQGSEKDIVIISCVRSHDHIGFLTDRSRINVMLTRAKYGLYIVGNLTWLAQQDNCWKALIDDAHKRGILRSVGNLMPKLPKLE
jgi:superfamily I DNA and/or RNA helicase